MVLAVAWETPDGWNPPRRSTNATSVQIPNEDAGPEKPIVGYLASLGGGKSTPNATFPQEIAGIVPKL
jgi:hypothetical protein